MGTTEPAHEPANSAFVHPNAVFKWGQMTEHEARIAAVLEHFHAPDAPLLGQGGEGRVYALGADEVVKVYVAGSRAYLEALAVLHARIAATALPFATPRIL